MAIITPSEVNSIAFVNALDPALILPEFINSASTKFVVPVVTQTILTNIETAPGDYTTLVDTYIKPYLAFCVKYMFYNQLLTETQLFPTSDDQRVAAIQEILSIIEIKRDLLRAYLNDNIFETPVIDSKPTVAGIFLSSNKSATSSSNPNTDVTSTLNSATSDTLSDADNLNFLQFTTGLLRKLSWSNVKATLKNIFDLLYSPLNHVHDGMLTGVSKGMFNLENTDGTLSVAPYTEKQVPAPDYPYFHDWDGSLPVSNKILVLESSLSLPRISAFNATAIPLEALTGSSGFPAAKFSGGTECSASNSLPVIKLHHNVGGTAGCNAILLQITRNISGTVSQDKPIININDDPDSPNVTGELLKATIDSILRINLNPRVADGPDAVAYMVDTRNNLANAGAKLLSLKNNGIEKANVNQAGKGTFAGLTSSENTEILCGKYAYHRQTLGSDTDGDWRSCSDASGFYFQQRVSGSFVTKYSIPA